MSESSLESQKVMEHPDGDHSDSHLTAINKASSVLANISEMKKKYKI
jgi:hypothetical protein